jgi:hypothetical protein
MAVDELVFLVARILGLVLKGLCSQFYGQGDRVFSI